MASEKRREQWRRGQQRYQAKLRALAAERHAAEWEQVIADEDDPEEKALLIATREFINGLPTIEEACGDLPEYDPDLHDPTKKRD